MQSEPPARLALGGQEADHRNVRPERRGCDQPGERLGGDAVELERHATLTAGLRLLRLVRDAEADQRDAGGCETDRIARDELAGERQSVFGRPAQARASAGLGASLAAPSGASSDLDFSSFIIGEGATTGPFILTIR